MTYTSHKDIIARWPTIVAYADDIGVSESTAGGMYRRNSIGPDHWQSTVDAASRRGYEGITVELLLALRPSRTAKSSPPPTTNQNDNKRPASEIAGPLFSATG